MNSGMTTPFEKVATTESGVTPSRNTFEKPPT
jgi:hypothetical protein